MNASSNIGIKLSLEGASQAEASLGRISQGVSKLGDAANSIRSAVGGLAGAFVGIGSAVQLVQAADAVTQLNNSLRLATGSASAAGAAYEALFAIAQRSRSNFTELGNTFASITRATQALGVSQQQVLAITETIGNAITVSGASAQASEAALMQLGQGLASGALRGEELNSILEQTPRLAKALADGLGVPVGALKKLGEQGALTAEAVIQALQSQQKVLAAEVSQSVATVGQAYTVLKNSAVALVGTLDQATGTSAGLAQAIMSVGQSLGDIQSAFKGVNAEAVTFDPLADAIATSFEAISVLGVNVAFVVKSIGTELGGLAAQAVAVATGQFSQAAEIGRLMRADAEKARQEVDALSRRLVNARQLRELAESANKGLDFSAEDARLSRQAGNKVASPLDFSKLVDGAGSAKKALKEVDAALDASRDMAKRWADVIADANRIAAESNASALDLSKGQARLLEYLGSPEYQGMDEPARQLALQQLYAAIATEQNTAAQRKLADMLVESQKAHAKSIELLERNASAAAEQVARLELEAVATDLAATSQTSLAVAIEQVTIARLKEQQAAMMADEAAVLAIQKEIDAREKLVKLITSKEVRDASTKAAEDAKREWDRSFEQVQQSLTDALMAGGKSGYEYIKSLFRTLVLRPIIQAVVNPVAGAITGALGFAGPANAAGTMSGLMPGGGFGGLYNGFATSGVGQALGLSGMVEDAAGNMFLSQTGLGSALGGALPFVGAGLAVLSLLKSLDDSGTMHTGGLGAYSAAGGASTGNAVKSANAGFFNLAPADYQASTETASVAMAKSIVGMLDATASTFGQSAGYYAATAFADDTSKDGAWGSLLIKLGDKVLADWGPGGPNYLGKEFADGEAGAKQYAAAVAKDVRDYLITQTPDWADAMLTALGDAPTLDQLGAVVAQINAAATAMDTMGDASAAWAAMTDATTAAIIKALGGAEAAVASMGSYYSNFYTDAERTAVTTQQLTDALGKLGIALPTTRDAYRALVDAALAAGDADLAAKLIGLSDAFASITNATTSSTEALQKAAADLQSSAMAQLQYSINRDKAQLQASADAAASLRDEVQTVFDAITGPIAELRAQAMGTAGSAAQGQAYINQALAAARGTGVLPDATALADAIGAVRNGITGGQYGNSVDQQFAAAKLAGELSALQAVAGDQLTEAERQYQAAQKQIEALDQANAYWQDQLQLSQSGIDATMSVADAVTALQEALKPGSTKGKTSADSGGSGSSRGYFAPSGERVDLIEGVGGTVEQIYGGKIAAAIGNAANGGNTLAAAEIWLNSATGRGLGSSDAAAKAAIEAGATAAEIKRLDDIGRAYQDIQNATGHNPTAAELEEELRRRNIPAFALGINRVPYDMTARIHADEAVIPARFNPFNPGAQAPMGGLGNTARLESLVSQLLERIASLEATAAQGAAAQQAAADTLASVTQGNALVTQAAPTF